MNPMDKDSRLKMLKFTFYYGMIMLVILNAIFFWFYSQSDSFDDSFLKTYNLVLIVILNLVFASGFVFIHRKMNAVKND